jgi:hypothetical protein
MKAVLVNYNFSPDWLKQSNFDYTIFDRSDSKEYLKDFPQERIVYTENIGNVDRDKLAYLIDNYDTLPDIFLWGKTNLFKFITKEEFDALPKTDFTPLLTQGHKTYGDRNGPVCFYKDDMYHERNDSWYLHEHAPNYVHSWGEWAKVHFLPNPPYIPFAPGGNYILTRERVHRYGIDTYQKMFDMLGYTQLPGEAHLCERSYYLLWA